MTKNSGNFCGSSLRYDDSTIQLNYVLEVPELCEWWCGWLLVRDPWCMALALLLVLLMSLKILVALVILLV